MNPRCRCACHGRAWWDATPIDDPVEALACCDLCKGLHRGVWTLYRHPPKRQDIPQADGNTDSEGPE